MRKHPFVLLREWNWKAATFSAMIRGLIFFATNKHSSHAMAWRAMVVEVVYATVAAGTAGAVTQRLRYAHPVRQTAIVLLLVVPLTMLVAQAVVHQLAGTPRIGAGLFLSFCFASFATGFNWIAMQHGIFVAGSGRTFLQDLAALPTLITRK